MSLAEGTLPCDLSHDGFDITYSPPVNSRRLRKHYLPATSFAASNSSTDILLMVMKPAFFVWHLDQHMKLIANRAVELLFFGSGWGLRLRERRDGKGRHKHRIYM